MTFPSRVGRRRLWSAALVALPGLACGPALEAGLARLAATQRAGGYEETLPSLRAIQYARPADARTQLLLGTALLRTGKVSRAIPPLGRAREAPDQALQAGLLLGAAFLDTRNFEEAVRAADRVLALRPNHRAALRQRAHAALEVARPDAALRDANQLLSLSDGAAEDQLLRARALVALERFDAARQTYETLLEPGAVPSAAGGAEACLALAALFEESLSDPGRAAQTYARCQRARPGDLATAKSAADFFERNQEGARALDTWREAVREQPRNPRLRLGLAALLERREQLEPAEAVLETAARELESAGLWRALAELRRRNGRAEAALDAVERALARGGADPERLRFLRADLLVDLKRPDAALEAAADFQEPAYRDLIRGRVHLQAGRAEQALRAFESGTLRWPNNAQARLLAGRAAEATGDTDRAISEYREAVRADESGTDAALFAARLYLATGRFAAAGHFAARHIRSRPFRGPEAHRIGARAAAAAGQFGIARLTLDALAGFEGQQQTVWVERAAVERRASGPQGAIRLLEQSGLDWVAAENEPVLRALVESQIAAGQPGAAVERARAALRQHPERAGFHELLGRARLALGEFDAADAAFRSALERAGEWAPALSGRAAVALARGDRAAALDGFERAAAADPADVGSAYRAAQLRVAAGQREAGVQRLESLLRSHPGYADACNDLAWLLAEGGGDLERALQLARRASKLARDASSLDTLGWVHLHRGENAAAVAAFERALREPDASPVHRYHLGLARAAAGDRSGALRALRGALAAGPFPAEADARARIARLSGEPAASPPAGAEAL